MNENVILIIAQLKTMIKIDFSGCPDKWHLFTSRGNLFIQNDYNTRYLMNGPPESTGAMYAFLGTLFQNMINDGTIVKYKFGQKN